MRMVKVMLVRAGTAFALCGLWATSIELHAQTATAPSTEASAPASEAAPERQPQALDALLKMGHFLRKLDRFEVRAQTSTDAILDNGQTVSFLHETDLKVQRPNRMRVDITGSRKDKGLIYDGKTFVIFNTATGFYSESPAPGTLDALVRELAEVYNIEAPLADLFYWGQGKPDDTVITSALFIGLERVDSRWCNHYAYQQSDVSWEIWLLKGSHPLPCRMVITDTTQAARPRHEVTYRWILNGAFDPSAFVYEPSATAKRIELQRATTTPFELGE
jgi:hypothetical protein